MKILDILFIIDPLECLDLDKDTTFAIMKETRKRGHRLWMCTTADLHIKHDRPFGHLTSLHIEASRAKKNYVKKLMTIDAPLERMRVIFMRKEPPFDADYVLSTQILSLADKEKTFIINDPQALRNATDKLGILQFKAFMPATIVSKKFSDIINFLRREKKIVLKPLISYAGNGIIILDRGDKNRNSILEMTTRNETAYIMAQQYLDAVKFGDKRILILDGEISGYIKRVAPRDDYRNNISKGGSAQKTKLNAKERRICNEIGRSLKTSGVYFAGLDMINERITEINISCPAGVVEINKQENLNLEAKILDFTEEKVK